MSKEHSFSTIQIGNSKRHIFDHKTNKLLCGVNRWKNTPFKIFKTKFDAKCMLENHLGAAIRREINPFKYVCFKCGQILASHYGLDYPKRKTHIIEIDTFTRMKCCGLAEFLRENSDE